MEQYPCYNTPPIKEALCEFHFKPKHDWDLTLPGKLQSALNQLGQEYTGKPHEQRVIAFGVEASDDQPLSLRYGERLSRIHLIAQNGTRMIGVGPDVLSVHLLHPYYNSSNSLPSGWNELESRILTALTAYWKVAEPIGIRRIGLKYINKIIIPGEEVRVEDYLRCAVPDVDGLPNRQRHFISRVEYVYDDSTLLILSQGLADAPPDHIGFLLDLDVIRETSDPIQEQDVLDIVRNFHARVRKAFETVITDKARDLFDVC